MSPQFNDAKTIFNGLALEYDAYRPGYPASAVQFLIALCNLDGQNTIADIGAGTGSLALLLAPHTRVLYAIDTADLMLEQLRANATAKGLTNIHPIEAAGERTGLQSHSLDFVVLSQVFHWMDRPQALKEIHRILKPGAPAAILWNEITNSNELYHLELQELIKRFNPKYKGGLDILGQDFPNAIEASGLFTKVECTTFPFSETYAQESFIGYMLSKSYVGMGIESSRIPEFMQEAHAILQHHFGEGKVTEQYNTVVLSAHAQL